MSRKRSTENLPTDEVKSESATETTEQAPDSPTIDEPQVNEGNTTPDEDLPKYTPEQLIKSSAYSHRRDVLRALLDDDGMYSHADIAKILKEFYLKEVE